MSQEGHRNLHNTNERRELADSLAVLAICRVSPSFATFRIRVGPNLGPQKSQLTVGIAGASWRHAVTSGHRWPAAARYGHSLRALTRAFPIEVSWTSILVGLTIRAGTITNAS